MEATIIRKTKRSQLFLFILAILLNVGIAIEWKNKELELSTLPPWEILPRLFCLCLLIYSVARFFRIRSGEIVITGEGVHVRGYGRVNWDSMESYGIFDIEDAEGDKAPYLIIRLKNKREVKCLLYSLNKTGAETLAIMNRYQDFFHSSIQSEKQTGAVDSRLSV
jgi:hypothetical protein